MASDVGTNPIFGYWLIYDTRFLLIILAIFRNKLLGLSKMIDISSKTIWKMNNSAF